jgi:hypothetical protein
VLLSRFAELEAKLLALGGERVFNHNGVEPHLDLLLEHGRVFQPKGRKRLRGDLHRCHQNAALAYARHYALGYGGTCEVATGYGLTDGMWWQHSWLWDGTRVVETTSNHTLYFGVVLPPFDAAMFVSAEVLSALPGSPLRRNDGRLVYSDVGSEEKAVPTS